jgi:hypothetical protein
MERKHRLIVHAADVLQSLLCRSVLCCLKNATQGGLYSRLFPPIDIFLAPTCPAINDATLVIERIRGGAGHLRTATAANENTPHIRACIIQGAATMTIDKRLLSELDICSKFVTPAVLNGRAPPEPVFHGRLMSS